MFKRARAPPDCENRITGSFLRMSHRDAADGRWKCDYRVPKVRSVTHYTLPCQDSQRSGAAEMELLETAISCLQSCPRTSSLTSFRRTAVSQITIENEGHDV